MASRRNPLRGELHGNDYAAIGSPAGCIRTSRTIYGARLAERADGDAAEKCALRFGRPPDRIALGAAENARIDAQRTLRAEDLVLSGCADTVGVSVDMNRDGVKRRSIG